MKTPEEYELEGHGNVIRRKKRRVLNDKYANFTWRGDYPDDYYERDETDYDEVPVGTLILFGSRAIGAPGSDVDLIQIADRSGRRVSDGIDLNLMTEFRWKSEQFAQSPFGGHVAAYGKVLAGPSWAIDRLKIRATIETYTIDQAIDTLDYWCGIFIHDRKRSKLELAWKVALQIVRVKILTEGNHVPPKPLLEKRLKELGMDGFLKLADHHDLSSNTYEGVIKLLPAEAFHA